MNDKNELLYKSLELDNEEYEDENTEILYSYLEERIACNIAFKEHEYSEKSQEYKEEIKKLNESNIEEYIDYSYSFLNEEELDNFISGVIDLVLFQRIAKKRYNKYIENGGKELF